MNTKSNDQIIQTSSLPTAHSMTIREAAHELGLSPTIVRLSIDSLKDETKFYSSQMY